MAYRVIQWATGSMGKCCLRAVIDHPDLELAGLLVYSSEKSGRDAGDIAHRNATGVIATRDVDEILSLDADVVIHAPRLQPPYTHHNEDIRRLLATGKNVISINGHTFPDYWGGPYVSAFSEACRKGGATLFGTGLNPGFIAEKIALAATGLCSRIQRIEIREVVEVDRMESPDYVFGVLGFGSPCDAIDPNDPSWPPAEILNGLYSEVVAFLVKRLGLVLRRVECDHVLLPATRNIMTPAGAIEKGSTGHIGWRWHGIVGNRRLVTLSIFWVMETAHLEGPGDHLWEVDIRGLPSVKISVDLENPADYPFRTGPEQLALAAAVIHSIPAVCTATPGILTVPAFAPYQARFGHSA
jgi:hypothetical protein